MVTRELPKLTSVSPSIKSRKKYHYHLHSSAAERRKAIDAGILSEQRKQKISLREAAIAKKGRLNILRIYRRYRRPHECLKITYDMRWIDRTYLNSPQRQFKAVTNNICKKNS